MDVPAAKATRKPRADGQRNRERLIEAAKAAFAEIGDEVSLEEIARRAGVGIGTLYRHFPNRDAVVEAVYRREVGRLAEAAPRLLETSPPGEALRRWMKLFVDYVATKRILASALSAMAGGAADLYAVSWTRISRAMALLAERAIAAGDIRPDADPGDLLRALIGFTYGSASPDWRTSAGRLIDLLMDGLRRGGD